MVFHFVPSHWKTVQNKYAQPFLGPYAIKLKKLCYSSSRFTEDLVIAIAPMCGSGTKFL